MLDNDVTTVLQDLPTRIRGFVTFGSDGNPLIVINSRMTVEQQKRTYVHELNHIRRGDLWNPEYDDSVEYGDAI